MAETRKLAAILAADVAGYSRLAGSDEDRTLARLRGLRSDLIDPAIAAHHGRVVKRTGDGVLIEFRSVVDAVRYGIFDERHWCLGGIFCASPFDVFAPAALSARAEAIVAAETPRSTSPSASFGDDAPARGS
jgi:class 3 adenylate cyclase